MRKQRKIFKLLLLILVFSLFSVTVCLAAPKLPISQDESKVSDNFQNCETKHQPSQDASKEPDENSETTLSISHIAEVYGKILKSEPLVIIVDKSKYKLFLFKDGKEVINYDIAIGKNPGQKQRVGDMTTPTGKFKINEIIDSHYWTHDFNDGNGEIEGAYGPWFISLDTGEWDGIGIHGTHDPSSIGTMASEGCIRMYNADVTELKDQISIGTTVVII